MPKYPVEKYATEIVQLLIEDNLDELFDSFHDLRDMSTDAPYMVAAEFIINDEQLIHDPDLVMQYRHTNTLTDYGDTVAEAVGRLLNGKAVAIAKILGLTEG